MSAFLSEFKKNNVECSVNEGIQNHSAWLGHISGLKAEKMLMGRKVPYLYVLRAGENINEEEGSTDYYVSFILPDLSVKHQPFVIHQTPGGWYYYNHGAGGIYKEETIEDVLHLIMHCNKEECTPLTSL